MARFFIDHPVFAWVIAILITLAGVLSISRLSIEAYPDIAPPQIQVSANYPGADAEVVEHTVTQIIEQSLTGIDHLLYFTSSSNSKGNANVTLTFDTGTDPDTAVVQTQNRMTLATPRLPAEVNALGLSVQKASTSNVIVLALQSTDGSMNSYELSNLLATRVLDQIQRINGVANVQQFGSEYAMRIWLNPDRLHAYGISPAQVLATVQSQNVQVAAGSIGAVPTVPDQQLSINVSVPGRFTSQDQFENIILRTDPNGTTVRLKDVARLELGPYSYGLDDKVDGKPIAGCGIAVLQNADVLKVVQAIRDRMDELQRSFPPGVTWITPFDATKFISVSIREVVYTLIGSVVLVFLVMLVFLQNIRATLIPTLVMPVALLGAFVGIYAVGFSINTLSLFGVALAIGIVVDDAIVVIESVERIMREEHLPPKEADAQGHGPDHRRHRRHHRGAGRGVRSERPADRQRRRHLPPVRADHRHLHAVLGVPGPVVHPRAVRQPAAARPPEPERGVPRLQPRVRVEPGGLHAPGLPVGAACAALDDRLRGAGRRGRVAVRAHARRLPARGGPGLRLRDRADPAGHDAGSHHEGHDARRRAHAPEPRRGCGHGDRRLQLRRPGRERRPGLRAPEALGQAQGHRGHLHRLGQPHPGAQHPRCAGVFGQPADRARPRPVRRLRPVPAGPRRHRPRGAGGGAEFAAEERQCLAHPHQRARQYPGGCPAAGSRHRSRAGRDHGPVDRATCMAPCS